MPWTMTEVSHEEPAGSRIERGRIARILLATFLVTVTLYLARVVFEPIAFALFGMALVWPFQKALETRLPRPAALLMTATTKSPLGAASEPFCCRRCRARIRIICSGPGLLFGGRAGGPCVF